MAEAILRQRFSADNAAGATAGVRAAFGSATVRASGALAYEQVSAVDDGVSVTRITASGDVRLTMEASPELVVVAVRDGRAELISGSSTVPLEAGGLGLIPVGRSAEIRWRSVVLDAFSIGSSSIERILGVEGRRVRLRAPRSTPRSPELALLWDRIARLLGGIVLEAPDLYERDLVRDQMIDTLAATTIEAFELSDEAEADVDRDEDVLRRAESFMRARLGDPLTVPEIARAAGVSLRGLQLLYQRRIGSTPLLHLRSLRVAAARGELERAPHASTVSAVARRFGYTNVGRFGAHYRAAFDESPSATLQRRRAAPRP